MADAQEKTPAIARSPKRFLVAPPGVGLPAQPVVNVEGAQMEVAPPLVGASSSRLGPCTAPCVETMAVISSILLVSRLRSVLSERLLER